MLNRGQARKCQNDLDKATRDLRGLIEYVRGEADAACARGDNDTSAKLREVEGLLTLAYAKGRTVSMPVDDGTTIQPLSGGK